MFKKRCSERFSLHLQHRRTKFLFAAVLGHQHRQPHTLISASRSVTQPEV